MIMYLSKQFLHKLGYFINLNKLMQLEMLSVENKPPVFNNLMSKETLHMYIFVFK